MNLGEFIGYRDNCPICNTPLTNSFISDRRQIIRLENGGLTAIFTMKSLKGAMPDYKAGYWFSLTDNSFCIDLYSEWNHSKHVPMHLIEKFKKFHRNLGKYRFSRKCTSCERYVLTSKDFNMDFKKCQVDSLEIEHELFSFTIPSEDGYKIIGLFNYSDPYPHSELSHWRGKSENEAKLDYYTWVKHPVKELPLIPFVSKEETTERLSRLITFS